MLARFTVIRVLTVFGTRPEAIKLAPVVRALHAQANHFVSKVCVTAQHRGMLDQVLDTFDIRPDFDLDLMRDAQTPAAIASSVLGSMPKILRSARPDIVLVQGDTMTTFSTALAAYLEHIVVGHVEAGLRTGSFDHPFPEEMNRCLTTRIADLHFAPTDVAGRILLEEGVPEADVFVTGNTVIDALLSTVNPDHAFDNDSLKSLDRNRPFILLTTHRRESFGKPVRSICEAVREIAEAKREFDVVVPVHPNPNVFDVVHETLGKVSNVLLVNPLGYADFANLMARARLILTDSGGIQEEAPALNIPVLVLRETTERPEAVAAGATRLVGTNRELIVRAVLDLLDDNKAYEAMASAPCPFGQGDAAMRILSAIRQRLVLTPASRE